jgi:hypothetical protein
MNAQDKELERWGEIHLKAGVLSGLPEGLHDEDPELLTAFEKKFDNWIKEHEARAAGVKGEDIIKVSLIKDTEAKAEYWRECGYEGLTVPDIESIRIDCIEHHLSRIEKATTYYSINNLPISKRLVLRQFLAYLERKKNPDNDYILPLDIINKLHEINVQNHYWKDETPEAWRNRFKKIVKDIIPFDQRKDVLNPDAYHTMIKEAADRAKKDNKIKNTYNDFALLRFGYSKFHHKQNANRYKRAVYTNISTLF